MVPEDEKLVAMYTTDVEAIRRYVNANTRYGKFVDPEVIRDINMKANMMTRQEFSDYSNAHIDGDKYGMVLFYQAIIMNDAGFFKMLTSKKQTEDEFIYINQLVSNNYWMYRYFHLDGEQIIPQYDIPEEILYLR